MSNKMESFTFSDNTVLANVMSLKRTTLPAHFKHLDLSTPAISVTNSSYEFVLCVIFTVLTLIFHGSVHILSNIKKELSNHVINYNEEVSFL